MTTPPMFLSHGAGPSFFIPPVKGTFTEYTGQGTPIDLFYRNEFPQLLPSDAKAILIFSAHWESDNLKVTSKETPSLYYDYYGFPPQTYELTWDAKHSEWLENRAVELLENAGFSVERDEERGLDHGVFIPLKVLYPEAEIPVVQMSILHHLDPEIHYRLGEALAPLTEEGVFIIGSGQTTHAFPQDFENVKEFDAWLTSVACDEDLPREERIQSIINFLEAPSGRDSHPRTEHFIPFLVAFGASKGRRATKLNDGTVSKSMSMSNFLFDKD